MPFSAAVSVRSGCAIAFWLFAAIATAQETSDWSRFRFSGNQTFSDQQLLGALLEDADFLLATHPHGDRAALAETTRRLLAAGYHKAGFLSPTVLVQTREGGGAVIQITEGQRFTCDQVHVNGAKQIDVPLLKQRLTQRFAKADAFPTFVETNGKLSTRWIDADGKAVSLRSPIWEHGKPTPFKSELLLYRAVEAALKDLGYSSAFIQVTIKSMPATQTADLVVDILQEGEPNRVRAFEVVGSDVNTPEQVLAYLQVQPGTVFGSHLQQRLTHQLWETGRFTKHQIKFTTDADGTGRLRIELADVPGVSPLAEPLSEAANVFLRARQWLSAAAERGEDLVLSIDEAPVSLQIVQSTERGKDLGLSTDRAPVSLHIVQSTHGTLVQVSTSPGENPHPPQLVAETLGDTSAERVGEQGLSRHITFMLDANRVGLGHSASPDVWIADVSGFEGAIRLEAGIEAAEVNDRFANFSHGFSWDWDRSANEPLLSQTLSLSPAGWCAFAYKENIHLEMAENKLIATGNLATFEIEIDSGRITRWTSNLTTVRLEAGLFERMRNAFVQQCDGKRNLYQPSQPVTSFVTFGLTQPWWDACVDIEELINEQHPDIDPALIDPALRSALEKLTAAGLFKPLDALAIHTRQGPRGERFVIPDDEKASDVSLQGLISWAGKHTLKCLPYLFAEESWPIKVGREACLVAIQRGKHTSKVLQELDEDPSDGPLRDASVAYLLSFTSHPSVSSFATRALNNMDAAKFDQDMLILLSGPCGRWIAGMMNGIASLSVEEAGALASLTKNDQVKAQWMALHTFIVAPRDEQSLWYQATHESLQDMLHGLIRR